MARGGAAMIERWLVQAVGREHYIAELERERGELLAALKLVVSSGAPCQREHPSMWDAWQRAITVIRKAEQTA